MYEIKITDVLVYLFALLQKVEVERLKTDWPRKIYEKLTKQKVTNKIRGLVSRQIRQWMEKVITGKC